MTDAQKLKDTTRVTLFGAVINILLGVLKIIFGIVGHSQALVADGVHSFSDLITDALVIIAARMSYQDADEDHPYGHGRFETVASVALAVVVMLVGIGILIDALRQIYLGVVQHPEVSTLIIALVSVLANEGLFHYTMRMANRWRSKLLATNAWHCRSDAASSLIVLVGIGGSIFGYPYLDTLAAVMVSLLIIRMGWRLGWPCIRELVDTGLDNKKLELIRETIEKVPGVVALHQLRTRYMAEDVYIDVHVLVDPYLSVSEGHYIGEHVRAVLIHDVEFVKDVIVHIDPEDDEIKAPCNKLPTREKVLSVLKSCWETLEGYDKIQRVRLHYLDGKIHVEVYLPLAVLAQIGAEPLNNQYHEATKAIDYITTVTLNFL